MSVDLFRVGGALDWLAATATIERVVEVLALAAFVACFAAWALRRRDTSAASAAGESNRHFGFGLLVIVCVGIALRLAFLDSRQQARFYFSQSTTSAVPYIVEHTGGPWASIRQLARNTHVIWSQESPILFAGHWLFQRAFGVSFELAGYVGAFWGMLAIVLAGLAGRATVSASFGLIFAAFVALSALQITWARLGGLPVASVAHTLLVVWVATVAGRQRSLWAAACTGALAFASLYHYYAARVAIPVAVVAIVRSLFSRTGERRVRAWLVLPLATLVFVVLFLAVREQGAFGTFWPRYTGYVGTAGERSALQIARGAWLNLRRELQPTLSRYFVKSRDSAMRLEPGSSRPMEPGTARTAGALHGGLSLLPLALLAGVGLAYCLLHPFRGAVWLAVALGGLLLPLLSVPSARRYLIFDLGCCALAAFGATWLWRSPPLRALNAAWRRGIAATALLLMAAWSGLTVGLLNATLPPGPGTPIPFGESGFRDGWTCLRCVDQGRRWAGDIRQNAFIVLFDADLERDNPTSPAGLSLYGRIAAHEARHPLAFVEFYSVLQNTNRHDDPPRVPRHYDPTTFDATSYLRQRIRAAGSERIVWEFRHPTAWEQALATHLQALGGDRRSLLEPPLLNRALSSRRAQDVPAPFQVWTSRADLDATLDAVERFIDPKPQWGQCLELRRIGSRLIDNTTLTSLGPLDESNARDPNAWGIGSYRFGILGTQRVPSLEPLAVAHVPTPSGRQLRILDRFAHESTYVGAVQTGRRPMLPATEFGRGCGAFAAARWWVADGLRGTLQSWPPAPFPMPKGLWFGASSRGDTLALAGAAQEIVLVDARTGQVVARFPARVSPASPSRLGDCSSIALGESWVATLNPYTDQVAIYSPSGHPLADIDLPKAIVPPPTTARSIAAGGRYLGIVHANRFELVDVVDSCAETPAVQLR